MKEEDVVASLAALAQPMRLRVFRALIVAGTQGLTPGALSQELEVPAATLSFHLRALLHAGLVTQERASRNLIYRAGFEQMNELLAFLTENCCGGQACGPATGGCKPAKAAPTSPSTPTPRKSRHEALPRSRSRQ